jgi:hypothetical protein
MMFAQICENLRNLGFAVVLFFTPLGASAQTLQPSTVPNASPAAEEETIVPTFERKKLARTYILMPGARGQ